MTQRMVTGDARLGQPLHRIQHLHSTVSTVIYSIYLQYSAMMDSEALRVRLFVAQSRLRHSQGSDWYISLDIFVLENTKNQAYALRMHTSPPMHKADNCIENYLLKCYII